MCFLTWQEGTVWYAFRIESWNSVFVFLSKFLPPFVYPLGLIGLLMLLALVLTKRQRLQKIILLLALVILSLAGNRWVAMGLARSLEWRYFPPDPVPQAEVMIVLGGGTEPAEPPRQIVKVNGSGDRVIYAAWLYKQGKALHILVSGGLLDWTESQSTPAQDMSTLLQMLGVPEPAIWLQPNSRNTYEDAVYCAQILRQKGINRALLVTSAWHMPRAVKLFQAQGLEVIPLPTDYNVTKAEWERLWSGDPRAWILGALPSVDHLDLTTKMLKEYMGILTYNIRGWK
jgi:uncharacterized SAM-binding protein YcdF (DUF218 family)